MANVVRMHGGYATNDKLVEEVKSLCKDGASVSVVNTLVGDIFKNVKKDEDKFAEAMKEAIKGATHDGTGLPVFLDQLVNNTSMRADSTKWAKNMSPFIVEITEKALELNKSYFNSIVEKWIKKKTFEGEVIEKLTKAIEVKTEEEVEEKKEETGLKRKREEDIEVEAKKQKV